jgi:hypothetical protein
MRRLLPLIIAASAAAGCKSNNTFAPFGPQTVPAPATLQTPYYPPTSATTQPTKSPSERLSVSAQTQPIVSSSIAKTAPEPADREPIRIVENPAAAARMATANSRSTAPANSSAQPVQPLAPPSKTAAPPVDPRRSSVIYDPGVRQAAFEQAQPAAGQWRAR